MASYLIIKDTLGEMSLTYEEMCKYHGSDFLGGVALSFKVLELAFKTILKPNEIPERGNIHLILGLDPPGILDGFEYATRAVSQRRIIIDKSIIKGAKSVFGHYYFEVHYRDARMSMWLKENVLPKGFTDLAKKCLGGFATNEEMNEWKQHKLQIGEEIIATKPKNIFEIGEINKVSH